ncbi:MAG: response regulator transcription factor [Sandaracinaceae bacterium]|nr:response regulator transcription factor [Sandaracinaceae bacterium]
MGQLLYVEDEADLRRSVARVLGLMPHVVREAACVYEARELVAAERGWCGFIVDHRLPDGEGLSLLDELSEAHPGVPTMLASGEVAAELANACARRGVTYVVKPFGVPELERFAQRAARFDTQRGALDEGLRVLAHKTRMTEREHEVLRLAVVNGFGHAPIADALGITRHTVKTHIRRVLRKSGTRSLDLLRARFRR